MNLAAAIIELEIHDAEITFSVVKSAYRYAIGQWHPDRFQEESAINAATQKAQQINKAYELLTERVELAGSFWVSVDGGPPGLNRHESTPTHTYRNRRFSPGFPDSTTFECFMKSSNILSAGYNPDRLVLYVKFHNGHVYEYEGVPKQIWESFRQAESHGKFGNAFIFRSFKYRRCEEPNQPYSPQSVVASRLSLASPDRH